MAQKIKIESQPNGKNVKMVYIKTKYDFKSYFGLLKEETE